MPYSIPHPAVSASVSNQASVSKSFATSKVSKASSPTITSPVTPILPLPKNLAVGMYDSTILDVADAFQKGECVGVDMTHELVDANGNHFVVRFRYYENEMPQLLDKFGEYGLDGALNKVAVGVQEEVDVAPKVYGNYMHIANRHLKSMSTTSSTTAQPVASTPATPSTTSAPPPPPKRGILGSNRPTPRPNTKQNLLADDEDDEFDDFLEEDD